MRADYLWTGAVMTAKEVMRGRLVLLMLALIPSAFYTVAWLIGSDEPVAFQLGSIDADAWVEVSTSDQTAVFIGLAATGLLCSFIALKLIQRDADVNQRLVLCGFRPWELVLSKLAVLLVVIGAVALWVAVIIPAAFFAPDHFGGMLLGFLAVGWVYGCYGLLIGALLRKELEGILFVALLTNLDAGWLQNPVWYADAQNQLVIRSLPAHWPSQAAMAAAFTDQAVASPLLGAAGYGAGLLCVALGIYAWRMRRR